MNRSVSVACVSVIVTAGSAFAPFAAKPAAKSAKVMVHCPNGNVAAFVTPAVVKIAVGDSVEWRTTGQVVADSIFITLKKPQQAWPFSGGPARGDTTARTGTARTVGTYAYNARLLCRQPNGTTRSVVIDPDIIIE